MPTTVAPLNPAKMRRPNSASLPPSDVTDGRAYEILLTRQPREYVALIAGVSVEEVDRRLQAAKDYEQKK